MEKEEQIDLDPEELIDVTCAKKKHGRKPRARGYSLLKLTANRETLTHRASEQAAFAKTVEIRQFFITVESVTDGNSSAPNQ